MSERWPYEADMLIVTGWFYAVPTRDIAAAVMLVVDRPVSRNAIIGRADRLGLPEHLLSNAKFHSRRRPPTPPRSPAMAMG